MNYQRSNGLAVDGIVGDETWKSITNKKKKKDENASFIESLKTKSGGWYYDRIQSIRKAQREFCKLGAINPYKIRVYFNTVR